MRSRRIGGLAVACAALFLLAAACDGGPGASPTPPPTQAAHDYCTELGFIDGERRNDAGDVIAECRLGPTPEGGAYSIARYSDDDGAADRDEATSVEITEYDPDGNVIQTTYGTLGD